MRTFVVNEIVASETPERLISLKCVPVKRESNTQRSEIEPLIGGMKHEQHTKSMTSSLSLAQKHTFSKKVLRRRSGVSLAIISTHTSRATAVGARLYQTFDVKPYTGTRTPIEVLENVTCQQNWPRLCFWERGSGPGFRPRAGPRL